MASARRGRTSAASHAGFRRHCRRCFLQKARTRAAAAHVVIANHALVFSESQMPGTALPPYAQIVFDEAHVTNVAVAQAMRGRGIGRAILAALMQYAANMGAQVLTLEVRKSNTVALALYQSMGFSQLGVRKRYYEDNGEDALLLVCDKLPAVEANFAEEA